MARCLVNCPSGSSYSVLLVISAFTMNALTVGISSSFGLYYVNFVEVFGETSGKTSWLGSINYAVMCASGLMSSYACGKIGIRMTAILGGLLTSIGFLTASFATNIYVVMMSLGLITGTGFGIVFTVATVAVAMHFEKHRPLALIIAQAGCNLGSFANSFLGEYLINLYGWRGAMLVTAGITLHLVVAASVLRPMTSEETADHQKKSLVKNWHYWLLHFYCILLYFGQISYQNHISAYALSLGFPVLDSVRLITIFSISGFFTRSFVSLLINFKWVNTAFFLAAMTLIPATGSYILVIWRSYWSLCVSSFLFSFVFCAIGPALIQTAILLIGKEDFPFAYPHLLVSMAVGALTGPPAAGFLYDLTAKYSMSFIMIGTLLTLAASCAILMGASAVCMSQTAHKFSQTSRTTRNFQDPL